MAKKAASKPAESKAPAAAIAPSPAARPSAARVKGATKGEILMTLGERTGLSKKEVASTLAALHEVISKELGKQGPGVLIIPGLLKLKVVRKAATPARPGINQFTKEPMMLKARPARNVVKAQPLKALKDLV